VILQPGALGDCILTLPLVRLVKEVLDLGGVDLVGPPIQERAAGPQVVAAGAGPCERIAVHLDALVAEVRRGIEPIPPAALQTQTRRRARVDHVGEDGVPDDLVLDKVAADPVYRGLDVPALRAMFRAALRKPAIRAALSRETYRQPGADAERSAVHAGAAVAQPRWRVWRERPFAVRDGDAILSGTIDRLVVLFDGSRPIGADVLDFKTDRLPVGDRPAWQQRIEFYRPQLEAYRRAVADLFRLDPSCISTRLALLEPGIVHRAAGPPAGSSCRS